MDRGRNRANRMEMFFHGGVALPLSTGTYRQKSVGKRERGSTGALAKGPASKQGSLAKFKRRFCLRNSLLKGGGSWKKTFRNVHPHDRTLWCIRSRSWGPNATYPLTSVHAPVPSRTRAAEEPPRRWAVSTDGKPEPNPPVGA